MERKYILAIHLQFMNDKELFKKMVNSGKPFIASLVPDLFGKNHPTIHSKENQYPEWAIEQFIEEKDNPNIDYAQEGYRHWCKRCYGKMQENIKNGEGTQPDPYHEHVCADGKSQDFSSQYLSMLKGREESRKEYGLYYNGYCPPNHSWNSDTLFAAKTNYHEYFLGRNGFDYFFPGRIKMPAYRDKGLIILPETKLGYRTSPVEMVYYDRNTPEEILSALENSVRIDELKIERKPHVKVWINDWLVRKAKRLRDQRTRVEALAERG